MRNVCKSLLTAISAILVLASCTRGPNPSTESEANTNANPDTGASSLQLQASDSSRNVTKAETAPASDIPESYKDIVYPKFKYTAPRASDYRVEIAEGVSGYIVSDRKLPLVNFSVYFENPGIIKNIENEAAFELMGSMFRRGGSKKISAHALDDSLEFISAGISTSAGTFRSYFEISSLTKDFTGTLDLAKKIITEPAFDKDQLEIIKSNYRTAYEQRFDTPAKLLSHLKTKVNYAPNKRLWDATGDEYQKVTAENIANIARGAFKSDKIVFALSGDVDRDSSVALLKNFFAELKPITDSVSKPDSIFEAPQPLSFLRKSGTYIVDKDVQQANISMSQPFVKRPHPDYYPTAVANFILGGGSFSSRLMLRVRSDEGLAYSVFSHAGNDYRDTSMVSISLQTKVESAAYAIGLVFEEIEKLAKEGPTDSELEQAKKTLVEALPSIFDSPASTATQFAEDFLMGKKDSHYVDYVNEINAVTKEQVKQMIAKYYGREKMTISVVGPVSKLDSLAPFTVISKDSLDFRQ